MVPFEGMKNGYSRSPFQCQVGWYLGAYERPAKGWTMVVDLGDVSIVGTSRRAKRDLGPSVSRFFDSCLHQSIARPASCLDILRAGKQHRQDLFATRANNPLDLVSHSGNEIFYNYSPLHRYACGRTSTTIHMVVLLRLRVSKPSHSHPCKGRC